MSNDLLAQSEDINGIKWWWHWQESCVSCVKALKWAPKSSGNLLGVTPGNKSFNQSITTIICVTVMFRELILAWLQGLSRIKWIPWMEVDGFIGTNYRIEGYKWRQERFVCFIERLFLLFGLLGFFPFIYPFFKFQIYRRQQGKFDRYITRF